MALRTWLPLLLAAVAFSVYGPSLNSDFVYDAKKDIMNEGFITSISNLPAVLSLKVLHMNLMLGDRPGQMLYLMLTAVIWGKEPFGYHLGSNLLHAANVALLLILMRRLLASELAQLAANDAVRVQMAMAVLALLFAVHPIAVEAVSAVNYSSDLLVTFFTLLALLSATFFHPDVFRRAIVMGSAGTWCAFAAVACKESGLAATLLLVVYWLRFRRHETKGPWLLFLGATLAVTGAFLAARFILAPASQEHLRYLGGSFPQVFLIQPRLWIFMMGKLLWPEQLSADYTIEDIAGLSTPVAAALLAIVVALQAWLTMKSRLGALGVAVFWLGLVTVSNFVPLYRPLADRFYYLPLMGVGMQLVACLLLTLGSRWGFRVAIATLLGAVLPLTLLTLAREEVFASDMSLWSNTLQSSPTSATAHVGVGSVLLAQGRTDEAIAQYQNALQLQPEYDLAHYCLGNALLDQERLDEAKVQFQKALEINPDYADAHNDLGIVFAKKGQLSQAILEFQEAQRLAPGLAGIQANLTKARKIMLEEWGGN